MLLFSTKLKMRNTKKYLLLALICLFARTINAVPLYGSNSITMKNIVEGSALRSESVNYGALSSNEVEGVKMMPKLVLIGVVYDRITRTPLSNSVVELVDQSNNQKSRYTTNSDGHFYFKLALDRNYMLYTVTTKGDIDDKKIISTINKDDSEILHAVLQSTRNDYPAVMNYTEKASPVTASANKDVSNELVFRLQVGAFKEKLSAQSAFVKGLGNAKINIEEGSNGYYRYLMGEFNRLEDAQELERTLKQQGYSKAFIVPYAKGERLKSTPEEAQQRYGK